MPLLRHSQASRARWLSLGFARRIDRQKTSTRRRDTQGGVLSACADIASAFWAGMVCSLRSSNMDCTSETLGQDRLLDSQFMGTCCGNFGGSRYFGGSTTCVFSFAALPSCQVSHVGPGLCWEARYAIWV